MIDERLERAVMVELDELDELPDMEPSVGMGDMLIAAAKDNTAEGLADIFIPYVEEDF